MSLECQGRCIAIGTGGGGEIMRALVSLIIPGHRQPNIKLEQPHFDATRNALGQR
ncbi:hypothetical protein [Nitrosospira multiformis]|uniref:hypothetical protein n=1 Tax=Nitrosospira multiformis TaxID=1231 RepID=UPI0015E67532|nr:hypothetical protein [Nitrosospira multiformis]